MAASSSSPMLSQLLLPPNSSPNSRRIKSIFLSDVSPSSTCSSANSLSCSISTPSTTSNGRNLTVSLSSTTSPSSASYSDTFEALIFDCDGVILDSENLHRQAYNDAFSHFNVRCPASASEALNWSSEFYDVLQNQIGGGKPKMRWYFKENGWPSSSVFESPPEEDSTREKLIDTLQDWKTERYKEIIKSGTVEPRPGVLRLMDEAKAAGIKLAVCSAATKSSVIVCLENLIGIERFQGLDCFLAGDDVKEKKPDPSIYLKAAKMLGVVGKQCLVVEDSIIGLQAARKAGMSCVITYTSSTSKQDFKDATAVYTDLSNTRFQDLQLLFQNVVLAK